MIYFSVCSWNHTTQLSRSTIETLAKRHVGSLKSLRIENANVDYLKSIYFKRLEKLEVVDLGFDYLPDWVEKLVARNRISLTHLKFGNPGQLTKNFFSAFKDHLKDLQERNQNLVAATAQSSSNRNVLSFFPHVSSVHLINSDLDGLMGEGPVDIFDHDKLESLSLESCCQENNFFPLEQHPGSNIFSWKPHLRSFSLRKESCTEAFIARLKTFFEAFSGLIHLSVLLESQTLLMEPTCFIKNHGNSLRTLVWDQRTGPITAMDTSTHTGAGTNDTLGTTINQICSGCPGLKELGLIMDVCNFGGGEDSYYVSNFIPLGEPVS